MGLRVSIFLLVMISCPQLLQAATPKKSGKGAAWQVFSSSAGGFSVSMPGTPSLSRDTHKSFVGSIQENTYSLQTPSGNYSVEYSDLPGIAVSMGGEHTIFDKAKEGLLKNVGGTQTSFSPVNSAGHSGMELSFQVPASGSSGKARFFLVQKRLYVLVGTSPSPLSPNVDKYLQSFALQ